MVTGTVRHLILIRNGRIMSVQLEIPPFAVFPNQKLTFSSHRRAWVPLFPTFQAICHHR